MRGICVIALAMTIPFVTGGSGERTAAGLAGPTGDKAETTPAGMVGLVTEVAEDGKSFSLKAKKGPYTVTWTKKTRFVAHKTITLADIEVGEPVHVLGEKMARQATERGGNLPAQLIKVQAIVVGEEFTPPPVPPKLHTQRLHWVSSKLRMRAKERWVDKHLLKAGLAQEVLRVWPISSAAPSPKTVVFIGGYLDRSDKKNPRLVATEVIQIVPKFKGYALTNDLENRKPREKDEKKSGGFGF